MGGNGHHGGFLDEKNMDVELRRELSTPNGTFGSLWIDSEQLYVTVERPADDPDHPCIPALTYDCKRFQSPHNGDCWLLMNVPGRTMIEIHSANLASQLRGCIAPGKGFGDFDGIPGVVHSKDAMLELYIKLGNSFKIAIIDA